MSNTFITAKFDLIRNAIRPLANDSTFTLKDNQMLSKSKDIQAQANIEIQLKKIAIEAGIKFENNSTTGSVKFSVKL